MLLSACFCQQAATMSTYKFTQRAVASLMHHRNDGLCPDRRVVQVLHRSRAPIHPDRWVLF